MMRRLRKLFDPVEAIKARRVTWREKELGEVDTKLNEVQRRLDRLSDHLSVLQRRNEDEP